MNNPEQGIAGIEQQIETKKKAVKAVLGGVSAFVLGAGLTWIGIENNHDSQTSRVSVASSKESTTTTSTSTTTTTTLPPIDPVAIMNYVAAHEAAEAQRQAQAAIDAQNAEWEARAAEANANGSYDRLANCETGGNWQMTGSTYSGGVGFANSTWSAYKEPGMPENAGQATKAQQIITAENLRLSEEPYGSWDGKWGCEDAIGDYAG